MDQITAKSLRDADWQPVYIYPLPGFVTSYGFTTYASNRLPGVTVTKEWRGQFKSRRLKHKTTYQFQGRKTDSPTQLVRFWNEAARAAKSGGSAPAGSAQSLGRVHRGAGV